MTTPRVRRPRLAEEKGVKRKISVPRCEGLRAEGGPELDLAIGVRTIQKDREVATSPGSGGVTGPGLA